MNGKIKKVYVPMTESAFYILFCLQTPQHGYGISQQVKRLTLSKMEKDGLIRFYSEEDKRRLYRITELGREVLETEIKRIERLYKNSKGENIDA